MSSRLSPLIVTLLTAARERSIIDRINDTLDGAHPDERARIIQQLERAESLDDILSALPDHRLPGAFLNRSSWGHLVMALLATLIYMAFFMFLAADGSANPWHVLLAGLSPRLLAWRSCYWSSFSRPSPRGT